MSLALKPRPVLTVLLLVLSLLSFGQRQYKENSVLATGNWIKIGVMKPGIHRVDLAFLSAAGLPAANIPSSSIRIYGNGGGMLPENNARPVIDDLQELAIEVRDGGDGVFNGTDYILFYSPGPHQWITDSAARLFRHRLNLYSDTAYVYLTIGGTGKRISRQPVSPASNTEVTRYDCRRFHELDTFNFLSSGKQWYGEEFAEAPGKTLFRQFDPDIQSAIPGQPVILRYAAASRSFGAPGRFSGGINGNPAIPLELDPVATGPYDEYVRTGITTGTFAAPASSFNMSFQYQPGSINAQGWLDWFEVIAPASLEMTAGRQLDFRDWQSVGIGRTSRFQIANATSDTRIWEVSNGSEPVEMLSDLNGTMARFTNSSEILREYIAFSPATAYTPVSSSVVANQNLHQPENVNMLIVTHASLLEQANRVAAFHRQRDSLTIRVVTSGQIFNEFSSGIPDPAALRNFVKMYYDRAGNDTTLRPRYLLLFGDGSFDYKNRLQNNTNLVPAYQSDNSTDPLNTYTSDDFFGFLDDADDVNAPRASLLDIGIGRIPAKSAAEAKAFVDKLLFYHEPASLGAWRSEITLVADDEDANLHLQDAEAVAQVTEQTAPVFNSEKVYLDLYRQQSSAGGSRYPEANQVINNRFESGNLIWNYNGHGGFRRLAEEVVLDQQVIESLKNENRLPLFITATCDVAPFDNPLIASIGENLLLRERTGAIALMTTTRLVFAFSNRVMNENYLRTLLSKNSSGQYLTLGEAVKNAKNRTYAFFGDLVNNRKFMLLGDPAMRLAFPRYNAVLTKVNGKALTQVPDTIKALGEYEFEGEIRDETGVLVEGFNGTVYHDLKDKESPVQTLGNDPGSIPTDIIVQKSSLFRGKSSVAGGRFKFKFLVPKDIDYRFGRGKQSFYADNGNLDAQGLSRELVIGGTGDSIDDEQGPSIRVYLNDEKFISGSIANENPVLLVRLQDSSGVNISGRGIGHDLQVMIDNDPEKTFVLNEFYAAELDDYKSGSVRYQLPVFEEGLHTLTVKAWDIANNSNQASIDFRIIKAQDLTIRNVLNYPNPFTTSTVFWFDHNRPNEQLQVSIQIFTVSGKLVKTLRNTIFTTGNRSCDVQWDGRDDFGSKLGRGVYIYNLKVRTQDGKTAQKLEKLYLL